MFKEQVAISYRIRILLENFFAITDKDNEAIVDDEKTLGDLLEDLPYLEKVDYHGHFGSNIFFDIDVDADTEENWKEIKKVITDYIDVKVV